jgi:hypothetical protein
MKSVTIIFGLLAVSSIMSCRVQTAPPETADVMGLVLLDSGMFSPTPSGVTVSLEGTNFSTITDDSGRFELKDVPGGTYTVRWSKPGYGDMRYIGATIQGGGNSPVYIAVPENEFPTGNITTHLPAFSHLAANVQSASFAANKSNTDTFLVLDGTYTDDEPIMTYNSPGDFSDEITAFFSHKQDVSPIEGHYDGFVNEEEDVTELDGTLGGVLDTANNTFHFVFEGAPGTFIPYNFHSCDSLYIAVYGTINDPFGGYYFDPTYNEGVITSYNQTPSHVIGLKIP